MKLTSNDKTLTLDFDGKGTSLSMEGCRLLKFREFEDKIFLIGCYHYTVRKNQLDWIEGRTSSDHVKRYNVRLNTTDRKGVVDGFDYITREVDYVILYEAAMYNNTAQPKIYDVTDNTILHEQDMLDLNYPKPHGDYIVYTLGEEVFFEQIKLAQIIKFNQLVFPNWDDNTPLFLTGRQIRKSYTRNKRKTKFTFIDLFAGLGGFHLALESIGGECVYASELRDDLRAQYVHNYGLSRDRINPDITLLSSDEIIRRQVPAHDVLCGGFPCQPFSKAGKRQGFDDEEGRGNMFDFIEKIVRVHRPKYLFLENVSNLESHDSGNTWKVIESRLTALGYQVDKRVLSPHQFGYPQHRKRIYIVGADTRAGYNLNHFVFPVPTNRPCDVTRLIDTNSKYYLPITSEQRRRLNHWETFLHLCEEHHVQVPKFPIWAMEWGATYDYDVTAPAFQTVAELKGKRGHLGQRITGKTLDECLAQLPNYAQTNKNKEFPDWKIRYIQHNREFYEQNREWLQPWLEVMREWENSFLKFEWNCPATSTCTMHDKLVQFRASGIRVKDATFAPALNLMLSQIPILPWVNLPADTVKPGDPTIGRYMTIREASKLQGMECLDFSHLQPSRVYEALGNAVNVQVVKNIAKRLINIKNHGKS